MIRQYLLIGALLFAGQASAAKISNLNPLADTAVAPDTDLLVIADGPTVETKNITPLDLSRNVLKNLYSGSEADGDTGDDSYDIRWETGRADTANTGPAVISVYEGGLQASGGRNQTISIGYNALTTGVPIHGTDVNYARFKIEGNWYDGADPLMEGYLEFGQSGGSSIRPYAATYNRTTGLLKSVTINGTTTGGVVFNDQNPAAQYATIQRNALKVMVDDADASPAHVYLDVDSHAGFNTYFRFGANGDVITGQETVQMETTFAGGSSQHRTFTTKMRSGAIPVTSITRSGSVATVTTTIAHGFSTGNSIIISGANEAAYNVTATITVSSTTVFTYTVAGTPATPATGTIQAKNTAVKTGVMALRADSAADSVMVSIGLGASYNFAALNVASTNLPTNYTTLRLVARDSQTRGIIEADTINGGTGLVESRGWQLYPEGYIAVRESGNSATDRVPSTGSSNVVQTDTNSDTITWSNKPGATAGTAPDLWAPLLSTTGALYWYPLWAD